MGYSYERIAEETGIPIRTVQEVLSGKVKSPRYDTMRALISLFQDLSIEPDRIAETSAYRLEKKQGEFTLEDYYNIPDKRRVELIDGVIYDMAAPTSIHQLIAGEIFRQISNYIHGKKGKCVPFISPIDVQLDRDNKTMVQPDVIIVCKDDVLQNANMYGAPDWVMEVLSPSTRRKDSIKKLNKYRDAGVREYWIVDPENRTVTVYDFENHEFPIPYTFDDQIPIRIYHGDLLIEMAEMKGYLARFSR